MRVREDDEVAGGSVPRRRHEREGVRGGRRAPRIRGHARLSPPPPSPIQREQGVRVHCSDRVHEEGGGSLFSLAGRIRVRTAKGGWGIRRRPPAPGPGGSRSRRRRLLSSSRAERGADPCRRVCASGPRQRRRRASGAPKVSLLLRGTREDGPFRVYQSPSAATKTKTSTGMRSCDIFSPHRSRATGRCLADSTGCGPEVQQTVPIRKHTK